MLAILLFLRYFTDIALAFTISVNLVALYSLLTKALTEALGTKVKIIKRNKKIKVTIELYQDKELDNLVKKLINLWA